ncbi:hypothetical protein [Desulfovibrio litoralis]|uniref:3-phosphoshikimate 1-carboxyvinyltransferase n=1 Tax=Desulfovibrio litoralis DSM 11393 TaxID=1121455 RepID=A0A1M7SC10_9BACT|nr:hypothetical protein [Desulfovibrio litoralis]SHN55998.1 3-phosphoshikimate 1-carboxyvinyltransferase [Desulfovibrio litoralis DSM 11393]
MSYFKKFPEKNDNQSSDKHKNKPHDNENFSDTNKNEYKHHEKRKSSFIKREGGSYNNTENQENAETEVFKPNNQMTEGLIELDLDLMKLLVRRSKLLNKAQQRLSGQAFSSFEKEVRQAFESNAQKFSRDPKFTRQFFNLIQDLKLLHSANDAKEAYKLSPARKPVELNLNATAEQLLANIYIFLGAYTMSPIEIANLPQTEASESLIQALNMGNANIYRNNNTLINATKEKLNFFDKSLFAGEQLFNFFLLSFVNTFNIGRCRINTGNQLKNIDLKSLRSFLPQLGARLAHQIPGSSSAPVFIESSGVFDSTLCLNGTLFENIQANEREEFVFSFCAALFTALSSTKRSFSITTENLDSSCQKGFNKASKLVLPFLSQLNVHSELSENNLSLNAEKIDLTQKVKINSDLNLSASFLALSLAHGGIVNLNDFYADYKLKENNISVFFNKIGIELEQNANCLSAKRKTDWQIKNFEQLEINDFNSLNTKFKPIALALLATLVLKGVSKITLNLSEESEEFKQVSSEFLSLLRLTIEDNCLKKQNEVSETENQTAFISPNPWWILALAVASLQYLGQFKGQKASLQLVNPKDIEQIYPQYWSLFNALPNPSLKNTQNVSQADEPTKRRFIAE